MEAAGNSVGIREAIAYFERSEDLEAAIEVRTWDSRDEETAVDILSRHSGRDVHVHGAPTD